ncbi:MAG: hypothetical protein JNL90_18960 [Planctomycetes bacterium]|nr:hypothetical protein [Planctomycetota bacterium]
MPFPLRHASTSAFVALLLSGAAAAQNCGTASLGLVPLDDLKEGDYLGLEGGLYPGRSNDCPTDHLLAGRDRSRAIVPLDASGAPAADGVIGVAAIGMSFTAQVFNACANLAALDSEVPRSLHFASLCGAGEDLEEIRDPNDDYWTVTVPAQLVAAGITAEQVQVAWILEGTPRQTLPFPDHVEQTAGYWVEVLHIVQQTFPNVKLAFLTPLYWQGYSLITPATEPYYYEQAWSVRSVVERQLAQDPELEWDASRGPVRSPWVAWGPYLWSDGVEPRSDGLFLDCTDFSPDGGHLGDGGMEKLGARLHHFLKSHRACTRWSILRGSSPAERMADVEVIGVGTPGTQGVPRLCGDSLPTIPHAEPYSLLVRDSVPRGRGLILLGDTLLPGSGLPFAGGTLRVEADLTLPVTFDLQGNGVLEVGEIPDDPALWAMSFYAQLIAFDRRGLDGRFTLSAAIELRLGD